ncbi:hypothetical protein THASP1DRAFT_21572 [Thamnocephalis sphaerospora]|uniref:Uncharacterized protein n=1 Tax=Thamnocephalis sphaerospora TaxID=78915 RepID=A0A4P9XWK6_9FUNG|nr:hypothetical protein THASP1DRAFT_21572 [Thamnocephalis sphaerospora]|eukprot:RKP10753.1 hypothetical protein THASP1DRAFT_21572 [Thamnocephalis sphaerospora]
MAQDLYAHIAHRQLLVAAPADTQQPSKCKQRIHLLRLNDGALVKSYTLPQSSYIEHVLGDLALLGTFPKGSYRLILFDMFAGTALRVFQNTNSRTATPAYLYDEWQQEHSAKSRRYAEARGAAKLKWHMQRQ